VKATKPATEARNSRLDLASSALNGGGGVPVGSTPWGAGAGLPCTKVDNQRREVQGGRPNTRTGPTAGRTMNKGEELPRSQDVTEERDSIFSTLLAKRR
jgi:hypothetical protein